MRARLGVLGVLVVACGPSAAPLDGNLQAIGSSLPLAQSPAVGSGRTSRDAADGCADATIDDQGDAGATWVALAPIYGPSDLIRQAQIVSLSGGTCDVHAVLTPEESQDIHTGFGGSVNGIPGATQPAGLSLHIVPIGADLWLFASSDRGVWQVDPSGTATHAAGLGHYVVGATPDGSGGAWVVTTAEFNEGNTLIEPAHAWHLNNNGAVVGTPVELPFDPAIVGFTGGDDNGRVSRFTFHPVARLGNGDVWVADSTSATLFEVGSGATIALDGTFPTGLAAWGTSVIVSYGTVRPAENEEGDTGGTARLGTGLVQVPHVVSVDVSSGDETWLADIPSDAAMPWETAGGFISGPPIDDTNRVPVDVWFPMGPTAAGVVVADPAIGRVFLLD